MEIRLLFAAAGEAVRFAPGETVDGITIDHKLDNMVNTVTLTAHRPGVCPHALEVEYALPEMLLRPADRLFYYDDSAHTNAMTHVYAHAQRGTAEIAQLALFKNLDSNGALLAGLLTLQRFWSALFLQEDRLIFRFELEDRELVPEQPYVMERYMFAEGCQSDTQPDRKLIMMYADRISDLNNCIPTGDLPVGWCSWSCYYKEIDDEKIRRAADAQVEYAEKGVPNLVQIDDGWQVGGSFCGSFEPIREIFPDMPALAKYVNDKGMTFGLWLAPCMLDDESECYEEFKHLAMPDITLGEHYHPFDLGDPRYHEHLRQVFRRVKDEYGARYFKLDFLAAAIQYFNENGKFVKFPGGYCVELLRRALQTIRETVGPDVFLLSCGAPTLIGAGIFNGARMSCDIIWGKKKEFPYYWTIMKECLQTVSWRYFYHRNVYVNDPDGVVLRDWDRGDGFNCSYSEAELWAIAVAMSGGAVLSNDELENLSPYRRRLYTELLPPLDIAGRPVDYFQQPQPTAYVLELDENTKFLALYNFEETVTDMNFDLEKIGMRGALVADCMSHKFLGFLDTVCVEDVNPHSAAMFLVRRAGSEPVFAGADTNIYMGVNQYSSTFDNGILTVNKPTGHKGAAVYALWPNGFEYRGEVVLQQNGYTLTKL